MRGGCGGGSAKGRCKAVRSRNVHPIRSSGVKSASTGAPGTSTVLSSITRRPPRFTRSDGRGLSVAEVGSSFIVTMDASGLTDGLTAVRACRIRQLYRTPEYARADQGRAQRHAALISAYHLASGARPGPVVVGWQRTGDSSSIEVFAGGFVVGPVGDDGGVLLSVPAGGRGDPLDDGALIRALRAVPYWTRVVGIPDGLLVGDLTPDRTADLRPTLDDCLLRVWREPFAWFVLAEPVSPADVTSEAAAVAALERDAKARSSPEYVVRGARLEARHRDLRRAESAGWWRIHLLAGADSPEAATTVSALLSASIDLHQLPYALAPSHVTGDLDTVLGSGVGAFTGSSLLLAALTNAPNEEVPGVRLTARPDFDVTAEREPGAPVLPLGRVQDHNEADADPFVVTTGSLNRHTFVSGATGTGKSQTIRALLESASRFGLPWLVVEPAKAEYRLMAARLGDSSPVVVIRPGDPGSLPAGINPLEPAPGFPLQTHVDLLRALFMAAFEPHEPFPQVLNAAMTRCYEDLGWDLVTSGPLHPHLTPRYPTLGDLQHTAERVVDEIGYSQEITNNVRGFVKVRLSSLRLGTTGRFFEGGHPLDFPTLMRSNVVLEIEDVGDDRDKAFLMGAVLIRLVEHLRIAVGPSAQLRHLTVVEEAHRLLRHTSNQGPSPARHAVELFAALLAEIRAYGEGLIVAEQIPSKLIPDVIKNTAVKIVHRLPARDDRDSVGATMNITDAQSRHLVTLPPGTAAVFTDGMDNPILVRMPDGTEREQVPRRTESPAGMIGRRSGSCGADCQTQACTLTDMSRARRVLAHPDNRRLTIWAELAVLAHLTGWLAPLPGADLKSALNSLAVRLRDCAISHAVDAAVAARTSGVGGVAAPRDLAIHVASALRDQLVGNQSCSSEESHWLARPYRWALVRDALAFHNRTHLLGRHPWSDGWAESYGRPIPGETCVGQKASVDAWYDSDQKDGATRVLVAFGASQAPSPIETAVGSSRQAEDWTDRVSEELRHFEPAQLSWPLLYLTAAASTAAEAPNRYDQPNGETPADNVAPYDECGECQHRCAYRRHAESVVARDPAGTGKLLELAIAGPRQGSAAEIVSQLVHVAGATPGGGATTAVEDYLVCVFVHAIHTRYPVSQRNAGGAAAAVSGIALTRRRVRAEGPHD
ncbi:ATP-binding protein [Micromonospora sp. NPDC051543]|uniref:ATP-binding protein n=1 Tax=Micromonospora sp. NPDC051543 TaxID=3364287 RepID=UPI0037929F9E